MPKPKNCESQSEFFSGVILQPFDIQHILFSNFRGGKEIPRIHRNLTAVQVERWVIEILFQNFRFPSKYHKLDPPQPHIL